MNTLSKKTDTHTAVADILPLIWSDGLCSFFRLTVIEPIPATLKLNLTVTSLFHFSWLDRAKQTYLIYQCKVTKLVYLCPKKTAFPPLEEFILTKNVKMSPTVCILDAFSTIIDLLDSKMGCCLTPF